MNDAAEAEVIEVPMFPLGSVLFPGGLLPLHIFEIRYQQLLNHALESDRRFGVVLISRGSEVGGGETRTDVGTLAVIDDHQRFDDGRAAVVCHGTSRFEVVEWLEDDPYPRARVRELEPEPRRSAAAPGGTRPLRRTHRARTQTRSSRVGSRSRMGRRSRCRNLAACRPISVQRPRSIQRPGGAEPRRPAWPYRRIASRCVQRPRTDGWNRPTRLGFANSGARHG